MSIGLGVLLFVLTLLVVGWLGGQETDLDRLLKSSRATAVMLAFIAVATAPLVEEMIYRGLLFSAFQRAVGRWFAVVAVTVMFAGLHVAQYWPNGAAIFSITLLSLVLTLVRAQTGQLLPCFVVHLVFNGIQSAIIVIEPYIRILMERLQPQTVKTAISVTSLWFN
jgi:membrane protease YdiL (CAAX protease family)